MIHLENLFGMSSIYNNVIHNKYILIHVKLRNEASQLF